MTIRELITLEQDIDVYGDEFGICMCGPIEMTDEGYNEWEDVLSLDVTLYADANEASIDTDDEKLNDRARKFFYAAAGYCSCATYDKWFNDDLYEI